jgi:hypothetical protein
MSSIFISRIAAAARTAMAATFIGMAAVSGAAGASLAFAGPAVAAPAPAVDPTTTGVYGDPAAAAEYWREQQYDDCVLMSVADVVGQITGHQPSEQEIIELAQQTLSASHPGSIYMRPANPEDLNTGMGADPADIAVLLAHYGVHGTLTDSDSQGATGVSTGIDALKMALAAGHAVIVGVNAETIWDSSEGQRTAGDHELVVIGVDAKNGIVHLNDSGTSDGRDEQVPLATFMKAWETSGYQMVVTEETVK